MAREKKCKNNRYEKVCASSYTIKTKRIDYIQSKDQPKKKKRSSYSMNNFNVRLSSLNNILKCKLSMHRLTIEFQFKTMQFTPVIVGHIQALEYIKQ